MSASPVVTALIDTYNQGRFIEEAVESVLAQDFPASEMEILVVDDGSTDDTPDRVRKFGDRVRYIRKLNRGQASAFNLGFAEARGEIVCMLDGDDTWLPEKVRLVEKELQNRPEAGIVFHPCQFWTESESTACGDASFVSAEGFLPHTPKGLLKLGGVTTSATTIRRSVAARVLPIPEDVVLFADAYLLSTAIFVAPAASLPHCLTRYRLHGGNLTSFSAPDPPRQKRSYEAFLAAIAATERWLGENGFPPGQAPAAVMLERMRLVAEVSRFALHAPGRARFFAHLRRHHRLYYPVWSRRYRFFHALLNVAGLTLGYARFKALREYYRSARPLLDARKFFFPAERAEAGGGIMALGRSRGTTSG